MKTKENIKKHTRLTKRRKLKVAQHSHGHPNNIHIPVQTAFFGLYKVYIMLI